MDITSRTKKQFTSHIEMDLTLTELQELMGIRPQMQSAGLMNASTVAVMDAFQVALTDISNKGG